MIFVWKTYSRRCLLRWTTSGCNSDARLSTETVVDSSLTAWQLDDSSDSWWLQRSLSREWLSICRQTRCHVSSRQLRTICFSASRAAVRSSMNRWYCCSTRTHELSNISYTSQHTAVHNKIRPTQTLTRHMHQLKTLLHTKNAKIC